MAEIWLNPTHLFDGHTLHNAMAARVENGVVAGIAPVAEIPPGAVVNALNGTLTPSFFDIQINGGGGVLFNTSPHRAGLATIAKAHHKIGTQHWLPTVITDAPEVMEAAVRAVLECYGEYGIAGIHIEGPHIATARKGTHKPSFIRPFDSHTMAQLKRLRAQGIPVLLTLAPEAVTAGQVAQIVALGVTVSMGHTNASAGEAEALLGEGATLFTHLFNAMSQMENRAPGVVGAAINSRAYCSIIADGLHVDPSMLALACRARPLPDHMILITDAMPTVGGPDHFTLYGETVHLTDGKIINPQGSLAGAHMTIPEGIAMLQAVGVSMEEALRMATCNPAKLMGLEGGIGRLIGAEVSDLIMMSATGEISALGA
ncbi:MAG TPA: N-acetylglucosamine-6-phosphate deacetylase [Rhodobacteraceae bacterium]|nr:N-acetylglucosamine-6-phosphate deacetylase [Paracoccaceae bacterium]